MKRTFTTENVERFLKECADDLQMQPTADVWGRIERRMNRRRRTVFFTSFFFLLTASVFGYVIVDRSKEVSDPFAGVRTIQKKEAVTSGVEKNTTGASLSPTQHLSANRKPPRGSATSNAAKLFQNPISGQDIASSQLTVTEQNNSSEIFSTTIVDEQQPFGTVNKATVLQQRRTSEVPSLESVVNLYKPSFRKRGSEFQLFFTPTISYRRLTENKSYLRAVPQNMATYTLAALYDVNSMVTHKPDLGLELGFAYKLPITQRIRFRTGMQFNITRYDIKAFTYVPERATIALNNRARGVDSVNTISNYRNFNGGGPDWIHNFYFQVSAPVGVEVAFSNFKKTKFGIATSIQPTYVLGDRAYLISSDYKNYSQAPWLIRHWNVNTSVETFVSYATGKLRWQVGPQMRYQLLSSFVQKYPVKENLFDFGLKMGVSLDKK